MLIKGMTLFLVVMAVLAMFGKLRLPGRKGPARVSDRCPDCGRPKIGRGPCPCKTDRNKTGRRG
ncbi:hypothetical protein BMG00_05395 [Thioclava marina]|jgi:hypothetical protein|uniref:Short-chain dehydrogenase n=1 Tax=Thioclava marina TaxID=1915077 RepID=A0ABX3MPA8_9RHOB|nr:MULTISPECIES: hypothetical protein [Thioclava]MBD3803030.1 hypothetical protein [Thioclava sp.]OOY13232.1 hypothetical protein BMG00_05395 [Thioclava marina]OOY28942.1 hypothetical protein BMI90_01295 [Thioclava sp. L04-15]